jgi:hypothetical protein
MFHTVASQAREEEHGVSDIRTFLVGELIALGEGMRLRLAVLAIIFVTRRASAEEKPGPQVYPSLGFGVGFQHDVPVYFHSWLGVALLPKPDTVAGFVAVGADIDIKDVTPAVTETTVVPVLRVGFSVCEKPRSFPLMSVYALAGFRRSEIEGNAVRAGMGITFPALLPLAEAGIPTMFEGTADVGPYATTWSFRLGWSF